MNKLVILSLLLLGSIAQDINTDGRLGDNGQDEDTLLAQEGDSWEDLADMSVNEDTAIQKGEEESEVAVRTENTPQESDNPDDITKENFSIKWWWWRPRCWKRGMTWKTVTRFCPHGLGQVGCAGCNPYWGDTICWYRRPILCINDQNMQRPDYTNWAWPWNFYHGWSGAHLNKTRPIRGCYIRSRWHADWICRRTFGSCWRMAEFHDGWHQYRWNNQKDESYCKWDRKYRGGWNFWGYGNKYATLNYGRFWVAINNQNGNCWN